MHVIKKAASRSLLLLLTILSIIAIGGNNLFQHIVILRTLFLHWVDLYLFHRSIHIGKDQLSKKTITENIMTNITQTPGYWRLYHVHQHAFLTLILKNIMMENPDESPTKSIT